jgi:hypothetical protein
MIPKSVKRFSGKIMRRQIRIRRADNRNCVNARQAGDNRPPADFKFAPRYCFFIAALTGSLTFSTLSNSTLRMSLPTFSTLRM